MFCRVTTEQSLALAEALAAEVKVQDDPPLLSRVREEVRVRGAAETSVAASAIRDPYIEKRILYMLHN